MKNSKINKKGWLGMVITASFILFSMGAFGQNVKTVKGEVLDLSCYMGPGAKGMSHKSCTIKCLEKGLPAGILGADGQVYLLVENHDMADAYGKAINHGGDVVEITGRVFSKGGLQCIYVEKIKI